VLHDKFLCSHHLKPAKQASAAMQMSPDKARELAQRGASILLLDLPEGTRVGLDHQVEAAPGRLCVARMRCAHLTQPIATYLRVMHALQNLPLASARHCQAAAWLAECCADCPVRATQTFVVAGGFKGFKMVPPGPHFLSYNAASRSGDFAPTIAQLLHLAGRQVVVRRWSLQQEMLLPLSDEDEVGHTVQT
jgi:AAR2 protein